MVRAHTARVGRKNKLARKENSDGPNAHTPRQANSVWPLSNMEVSRPDPAGTLPATSVLVKARTDDVRQRTVGRK